jgi:hypothetical protein
MGVPNSPSSTKGTLILQLAVLSQIAASVLIALGQFRGVDIVVGGRLLVGWERTVEVLKDMSAPATVAAVMFMAVILWSIRRGDSWAKPFLAVLLIQAGLHLVWGSAPWFWVYRDTTLKTLAVAEALFLAVAYVALFLPISSVAIRGFELLRVSTAVVLAVVLIYVKGHYSFCCPQYGPTPPDWVVYLDVSGLWDRPRETGFLIAWGCLTGILAVRWCVRKLGRLRPAVPS